MGVLLISEMLLTLHIYELWLTKSYFRTRQANITNRNQEVLLCIYNSMPVSTQIYTGELCLMCGWKYPFLGVHHLSVTGLWSYSRTRNRSALSQSTGAEKGCIYIFSWQKRSKTEMTCHFYLHVTEICDELSSYYISFICKWSVQRETSFSVMNVVIMVFHVLFCAVSVVLICRSVAAAAVVTVWLGIPGPRWPSAMTHVSQC